MNAIELGDPGGNCGVYAGRCVRFRCHDTSGVYLCSENGEQINISCFQVGHSVDQIGMQCCPQRRGCNLQGGNILISSL